MEESNMKVPLTLARMLTLTCVFLCGMVADRLLSEHLVHAQVDQSTRSPDNSRSLTLGVGVKVTVGMPKEEAVAGVGSGGFMVGPSNPAIIFTLDNKKVPHVWGKLRFENGVVTEITRQWGEPEDGTEIGKLWKSLWGVVNTVSGQDYLPISIRVQSSHDPYARNERIDLRVGIGHIITIQKQEMDLTSALTGVSGRDQTVSSVFVSETVF